MQRLNPLNDYLFQKILGEKGDEEQLLSFLNAVLKRTHKNNLVSIEIIENKKLTADIIGSKTSILDVRAVTDNDMRVNIEVQLRNFGNMDRRSLFYWSREYSKGIIAGQDYIELPDVIAINIVNFEFIPINNFHTTFHLREDSHKKYILTDALEIHFIDMIKFKRLKNKDIRKNSLHRWLSFFDKDTPDDILKEVFDMDKVIFKADEKIRLLSDDYDTIRQYEMREMALSDYTSGINYAKREGIKEVAKNALREGSTVEFIEKITGLNAETIKRLQAELDK